MQYRQISLSFVLVVALVVLALPFVIGAQDDMMDGQNTTVHYFADASEVDGGWAHLHRAENGLLMSLHTSDLSSNEVYTVWWVVFNEPGNCSDGVCGEDDILIFEDGAPIMDENNNHVLNMDGIEASDISAFFASGAYVNEDGTAHFGGSAGTGDTPGIIFGSGLHNPMTAEVHLVVRTHGPMVDDMAHAQITSFEGGCGATDNGLPCADHQFAVFLPPMG